MMTEANRIKNIIYNDVRMVAIGIIVAAGIVLAFFGSLFLIFAFMLAGSTTTTAEILSPDKAYIASIDESGGGAVNPILYKIYVQSNGKTIFDPRILVATIVSPESNDHKPGLRTSWLSPNDLQITYARARDAQLYRDAVVNGRTIRIISDKKQ
jgi:hypothetical protein